MTFEEFLEYKKEFESAYNSFMYNYREYKELLEIKKLQLSESPQKREERLKDVADAKRKYEDLSFEIDQNDNNPRYIPSDDIGKYSDILYKKNYEARLEKFEENFNRQKESYKKLSDTFKKFDAFKKDFTNQLKLAEDKHSLIYTELEELKAEKEQLIDEIAEQYIESAYGPFYDKSDITEYMRKDGIRQAKENFSIYSGKTIEVKRVVLNSKLTAAFSECSEKKNQLEEISYIPEKFNEATELAKEAVSSYNAVSGMKPRN